ncbi:MAG TPA: M48 family metalloprotease, partial [Tepidisphaeraceae bacterium]|nr:M48 family metalloprotease [Tepidisphaeraceae bacterium]
PRRTGRGRSVRGACIGCLFLILALSLLALSGGCQAPAPAAKFVAQAQALHDQSLASTVASDGDLAEYVQDIADRIAAAAKQAAPGLANADFLSRVRCHLVNCDTINVFCTGGTHIYVYAGLLRQCQSEDELAAAIAHAYAHLIRLDLEKTRMRPDPRRLPAAVAWEFVINRFTLAQEENADRLAVTIYAKAGWDPSHFPVLFERLEAFSGGNVAPDRQPLPVRAADVRATGADLPKMRGVTPVADPRTFILLRDRAARMSAGSAAPTVSEVFLRAFPNCMLSGDTSEQREAQERLRPPPPPPRKLEPS